MAQNLEKVNYTINRNEARQGFEIAFSGKPSAAVRDALKALHFRWHEECQGRTNRECLYFQRGSSCPWGEFLLHEGGHYFFM